jgi:hypothetical protein
MRTYLIAYDLAQPQSSRHAIAAEIMRLGQSWARPLEQTWYVRSEADEGELEARLAWMLGGEDGLLIQAVEEEAVLVNTRLRWFRQRHEAGARDRQASLIRFPSPAGDVSVDDDLSLAEAC